MIEAMAAGLPVVMTDVGLVGEVVKDGESGVVVPVGDAGAMLAATADLYRNSARRVALAATAQRTAREMEPKTKDDALALYKRSFISCTL